MPTIIRRDFGGVKLNIPAAGCAHYPGLAADDKVDIVEFKLQQLERAQSVLAFCRSSKNYRKRLGKSMANGADGGAWVCPRNTNGCA